MMNKILYTLILIMACTFQGCVSDNEPEGPSVKVGDSLPVFSVVMNNGEQISSESLKGHVAVIVFFNTECSDCQKELPVIQKLWDHYTGSDIIKIVPIAREESQEEIADYWSSHGLSMPFSPQPDRAVYSLFASSVIPRIYVTDTFGIIRAAYGDTDMPSFSKLTADIEAVDPTETPKIKPTL